MVTEKGFLRRAMHGTVQDAFLDGEKNGSGVPFCLVATGTNTRLIEIGIAGLDDFELENF